MWNWLTKVSVIPPGGLNTVISRVRPVPMYFLPLVRPTPVSPYGWKWNDTMKPPDGVAVSVPTNRSVPDRWMSSVQPATTASNGTAWSIVVVAEADVALASTNVDATTSARRASLRTMMPSSTGGGGPGGLPRCRAPTSSALLGDGHGPKGLLTFRWPVVTQCVRLDRWRMAGASPSGA